jgi:enoyl-[acyl-carrier-protein] reductase (NADH)
VATNKRYAAAAGQGFTVSEVAKSVEADFGKIDIIVHSLANGPEVTKPLLETSRKVRCVNARCMACMPPCAGPAAMHATPQRTIL